LKDDDDDMTTMTMT